MRPKGLYRGGTYTKVCSLVFNKSHSNLTTLLIYTRSFPLRRRIFAISSWSKVEKAMEGSIGLKKCRFSVSTRYAVTFVEGLREFSIACLVQFSSVRNYEGLAGSLITGGSEFESQGCPLMLFFFVNFLPNCVYSGDNLRSRPKKERTRERGTRVSPSRALVLSCAHYYQAPATQATVGFLKPALLEEDCLITTFSENKRFSIFTLLFFCLQTDQ